MADKVKTVRGSIGGVNVETSEENAERLGARFEPEVKAAAKKASSSKSEK